MNATLINGKNTLTRLIAACAATLAVSGATIATASDAPSPRADQSRAKVGEKAPDFTLTDLDGKSHKLSDMLDGETIVILEWFNPECPFVVKHYGAQTNDSGEKVWTMNALHERYADKKVKWVRINSGAPGKQGAGADLNKRYASDWKIKTPILLDESGEVGRQYGATNTPDMFIIDANGVLAYSGAIDNNPHPRTFGDENYVEMALTQLLAGETVSMAQTKPYGCAVKYAN